MKKILTYLILIFCVFQLSGCNDNIKDNECEHPWGQWQYNDEVHWRDYLCGHQSPDVAGEHVWDEGVEIEDGIGAYVIEYTCTVCGKKEQQITTIIPPTPIVDNILIFAIEEKEKELTKHKDIILANIEDVILADDVTMLFNECISNIKNAESIHDVNQLSNKCIKDVYNLIPKASGEFDFSTLDQSEKDKILSLLDEYIFRNNTGGIATSKHYTLNLNSTTKEKWTEFFGVNGTKQQTQKENYWDVKQFLSNKNFLKGLSLALEKETSQNDVTDYLLIDYSKYEFYNYDLELARKYFALAMEELSPVYAVSSQYPVELKLEIAFGSRTKANEELFNNLKSSIETAFNHESVSNKAFILTVEAWYGEIFGQIYGKLYNGQFDLSYDKISGSSYDLYMNYKLLSSSSYLSNNLTINWSIDTNNIEDDCIVYNGYRFSYDSLLSLLISKQIIFDGQMVYFTTWV